MKFFLLGLPNLKAIYEKSIIQQNFYKDSQIDISTKIHQDSHC